MPEATAQQVVLGLDIGSVSVNAVVMDRDKNILEDHYHRTQGQPIRTVIRAMKDILTRFSPQQIRGVGVTGSGGKLVDELVGGRFVNEIVAQSKSVTALYPQVRTVVEMGGEDSKLLILGEGAGEGALEDFAMNTMCAAGTGSFLDQQASRLGLSIEEFGALALKSENPPRIAGRCSVFAKSDMIHLQQVGTPDYDIVAGLCHAVARNLKSNIGKGKRFAKQISFQGGVAANQGMVRAFENVLELDEGELVIPEHYASMGAIGAAMILLDEGVDESFEGLSRIEEYERHLREQYERSAECLPPLELTHEESLDFLSEKYPFPADGSKVEAYLGVDVGSLSTNLVAIDAQKRIIARRYLATAGRPLEAIQQGLGEIGEEVGDRIVVLGVASTGSGRYLTGDFVGADIVRNEITAQATAAIDIDPEVDTVFEIGGQDSKYISIDHGAVVDFEMNKVCAAGTGSFLEEQAEKLDLQIEEEFGRLALGAPAPVRLGERCTVFMESDLVSHQQRGARLENLVGGLGYSIVYNYLNRVVGDRRVGDHIFFQGGVAWNKGVVAAFEAVTAQRITVPPHHDVTGAIGAAILAMRERTWQQSRFKGFDLSKRQYTLSSFECNGCANRCEIHKVTVENERPLFYGGRCEKYEVKERKKDSRLPDLFEEREQLLWGRHARKAGERKAAAEPEEEQGTGKRRVGIPRALYFYEYFPYWNAFFEDLGFEVVVSDPTNRHLIGEAAERAAVEACFPVKVALGHMINLLDKEIDFLFVPSIITTPNETGHEDQNSYLCPYVQSFPYMMRALLDWQQSSRDQGRELTLLEPHVSFQLGHKATIRELTGLAGRLGVPGRAIRRAADAAELAQKAFQASVRRRGQEILAQLRPDQRAIVIVSRPYNGCDAGLNLALPRKLGDLGVLAIPMDFLPLNVAEIDDPHMYWRYGQNILSAARIVRGLPNVYALYITNFGCGPDSFISHFFREEMEGKPCLQIEIDEHSADAGMITRCEAFLDSLKSAKPEQLAPARRTKAYRFDGDVGGKVIYFPPMCDHAELIAAAFRAYGVQAEMLPESDERTLELGKRFTTGRECFPCVVTSGDLLKKVEEPGFDPSKTIFFMPTASGPCRFGQYYRLQRMILDELGHEDVQIISPSSSDSYAGLGNLTASFHRLAWRAMVAGDILHKLLHETRPYELHKGEADATYRECLQLMCDVIENGDGGVEEGVRAARKRFEVVRTDRSDRKPIIGVVGEIFLRANRFSNAHVIESIEALGGEAWLASMSEWFFYVNWCRKQRALAEGRYFEALGVRVKDWVQTHDERRLVRVVEDMLLNAHEPHIEQIIQNSAPYMHHSFGGEAILTIGKAIDYVKEGLSGVVNTMPLYCMPGTIVSALSRRVREDLDNVPWLNLSYDGQQETNAENRLQAFMHQARQYQQRTRFGVKAHGGTP